MTIANDYFLLLGPYESGLFCKKILPRNVMEKIIFATRNAIMNHKSKVEDFYEERVEKERIRFLEKYFEGNTIKMYPESWIEN
jgi:hypothetical protein